MTERKRIVVYCQPLSGAGHFVRSREIVRALSRRHQVHFVLGGRPVPGPGLDRSVQYLEMPPIYRAPQGLKPEDAGQTIEEVLAERQRIVTRGLSQIRPDVLVIEHFPFSKWELQAEVLAAIEAARAENPRAHVVCSVRDYPASSDLARFPERFRSAVVSILNEHFTALLVHSDPRVVRLESQFDWVRDISIPIHYTGYVSEKLPHMATNVKSPPKNPGRGYVLVSSGGLADGLRLATLCSAAWRRLDEQGATAGRRMVIFAGLFAEENQYEALERTTRDGPFCLRRFASDFLQWMPAAELSISQGGYNTTMNVLETRTRAILAPNRRMSDQTLRARILAEREVLDVIDPETITADELADRILHGLARPVPQHDIALDGAERTVDVIEAL
jgi:predicted glycosyltransferase